jgi:hypothetical protein
LGHSAQKRPGETAANPGISSILIKAASLQQLRRGSPWLSANRRRAEDA